MKLLLSICVLAAVLFAATDAKAISVSRIKPVVRPVVRPVVITRTIIRPGGVHVPIHISTVRAYRAGGGSNLSTGAIVGIVLGAFVGVAVIGIVCAVITRGCADDDQVVTITETCVVQPGTASPTLPPATQSK